jgi:hypothetical protein
MPRSGRLIGLPLALGLVVGALAAVPRAGADQVGPVVAGEDAFVSSSSLSGNFDTSALRARNTGSQRIQS